MKVGSDDLPLKEYSSEKIIAFQYHTPINALEEEYVETVIRKLPIMIGTNNISIVGETTTVRIVQIIQKYLQT